ncbi:carbon-nitrogen hydrolase family protein [Actinoplanes couchii]|uniref:CN hydrolase domain-containing protein n=1 Tax=Actinoplanes couchii TaxID=403638 RepID=A0ABQ3XMB7_9ACTN|nr:carbon-nitrogen hydrolase family protein [Actinoplanes couchii]MDR6319241.1 putative amidohydrolase [Actinoplanes couchii]GID59550.1 hypothetical protein Aco03nite_079540 [Actinoplanes couchii]
MLIGVGQTPEILGDVDAAVDMILGFVHQADVDLLVLPECFLQGYLVTADHVREQALEIGSPEFGAVLRRLSQVRPMLVVGMIERSGGAFHNTAVVIAGGEVLGRYRKNRLTAGESPVFAPGDDYPVFDCKGVRFGINICYDAQFPEPAARIAAAGATLLVHPSQNMMPADRAVHWQHQHNKIRARRVRETGLWLAAADITGTRDGRLALGPTCVLNPDGEVVAQVPTGTTGMATFRL